MSAADLQAKAFTDDTVAREAMEALLWPNGPVCPHCGCTGKIGKVEGNSARRGLYYCGDCKGQFTVTVGTIFERSKIPAQQMVDGNSSHGFKQEGHERPPTPSYARRYLPNSMVHGTSHS